MRNFLNRSKLKIHTWGGLGSQLFALAVALDIKEKYPKKNIQLVLHSSGVTKRNSELNFLDQFLEILTIDDFGNYPKRHPKKIHRINFNLILKSFFVWSGLISTSNDDTEFNKVKPWVKSLRGHYSHRSLSIGTISKIFDLLKNDQSLNFNKETPSKISIHYRLGDLLSLANKNPVPNTQINKLLSEIISNNGENKIDLYSDSLDYAANSMSEVFELKNINKVDLEIKSLILKLVTYQIFIGTNSKITIWTVLFRILTNQDSQTFIPYQMKEEITRIYPEINNLNFIDFY
jgi:hypothetical protein